MITIENLNKSYGKKEVLKNLNLSLTQGEVHGLVGENGAGKTTLFECMNHLQKYEGLINISPNIAIGYMPTDLYFYPCIRAMEYLEFCLAARKIKATKDEINDLNRVFELPLKQYATEYSTGMKKKLVLMSLFLQKNDFYILDEPFNGLDLSASLLLKKIIQNLKHSQKTILISSHIISSLTDICDQIHYLKKGSIYHTYLPSDFQQIETDIISGDIKEKLSILDKYNYSSTKNMEEQQIANKKKRDEILFVGNHTHQVDIAYINFMYEVKMMNAASTYSLYTKRLEQLMTILNIGDHIIIETIVVKNLDDLVSYLTKKGFRDIINDLEKIN